MSYESVRPILFLCIEVLAVNEYQVAWRLESRNGRVIDRKAYKFSKAAYQKVDENGYYDHFIREELMGLYQGFKPAIVLSEEKQLQELFDAIGQSFSESVQLKVIDKEQAYAFEECISKKRSGRKSNEGIVIKVDCLSAVCQKEVKLSNLSFTDTVKNRLVNVAKAIPSTFSRERTKKPLHGNSSLESAEQEGCWAAIRWLLKWIFYFYLIFILIWLLVELTD